MSSNINYTTIDESFPIAGQDNNTAGFRDNFTSIKTAFQVAKTEITTLQSNSLLKATLTGNDPVVNDLNGSTISNGLFTKMFGVVHKENVSTSADIDISNGPFQVFTLSGNAGLVFTNWASIDEYASVKVHLKSNTSGSYTPTLSTENAGTVVFDSSFPNPFTLNVNGKHKVIEAWSYDHGAHVYVRYLGEF